MESIAPGLSRIQSPYVGQVYIIEDSDGLTLIDASMAMAASTILHEVALHPSRKSVRRIVITHAHPDHVGGLFKVQRTTGAEVIASAGEQPVIEGKTSIGRVTNEDRAKNSRMHNPLDPIFNPVKVNRVVGDTETIPEVFGGLQAFHTPGHAPGHLCYWQPERRILLCGDVLMNLRRIRLPFAFLTPDMPENIRSIRRVADLRPDIVCFGHGPVLRSNTADSLLRFAESIGS